KAGIYRKWRINEEGLLPQTWWDKSLYSAPEYGTNLLTGMFGSAHSFMFPKSLHAVADCLRVAGLRRDLSGIVLDFFAGSGTTGHAIIELNRSDCGRRRFILVEMGNYFEDVLKARIVKALYSSQWIGGRPVGRDTGQSAAVKVLRLESYEDALANLGVSGPAEAQAELLAENGAVREDYMLRYVLDQETAGSASMLNIRAFDHPFAYKLKVAADTVGETKEVNVDLVETFNWLLGLRVHTVDVIRGFHIVTGRLPGPGNSDDGEKALIIWRDTTENPNEKLDLFFRKQNYNTLDQEFDVIYVNGDNNLQNLRKEDQTWKVRLIEEEFHRLMWDVEDV
ncbi:MAG TPA: DNA methyltransferase, partial [Chthonomonadales bacterium]|nr:DNA methyltransferase [Chthonomonadales bacterium]